MSCISVLKDLASKLGPMFAHLSQQFIDTGVIPSGQLQASAPLQKGDRSVARNYRSISLTCVHANYLKRMFAQILWHIWMNINFVQTDSMHSIKSIAVKLSRSQS